MRLSTSASTTNILYTPVQGEEKIDNMAIPKASMKPLSSLGCVRAAFVSAPYFLPQSSSRLPAIPPRFLLSTSSPISSPRSNSTMSSSVETLWHAAYPTPRNTAPEGVSPAQLLSLLRDSEERVVLVDLRRNDHEVCRMSPSFSPLRFISIASMAQDRWSLSDNCLK